MKKIKYIGYYAEDDMERNIPIAGKNKMDYVIEILNYLGYEVDIVSPALPKIGIKSSGNYKEIRKGINLKTFDCFLHKNKVIRFFDLLHFKKNMLEYLLKNTQEKETVLVYHSLALCNVMKKLKRQKNIRLILETEEIYTDVKQYPYFSKEQELKYLQLPDAYIFPTELLNKKINTEKKRSVIVYGNYSVQKDCMQKFEDEKIHIVYAGNFSPIKGGAFAAIQSAAYLTSHYVLHILGFGSNQEVLNIKECIKKGNLTNESKVVFEGLKTGDDYIQFIQKCDIGLSTQNPEASFNDTSFPSKILSYMSNGLRVVSAKIPVVENSAIGEYMYYYDKQIPEQIAQTIRKVDLTSEYDGRSILKTLDKKCKEEMRELL